MNWAHKFTFYQSYNKPQKFYRKKYKMFAQSKPSKFKKGTYLKNKL